MFATCDKIFSDTYNTYKTRIKYGDDEEQYGLQKCNDDDGNPIRPATLKPKNLSEVHMTVFERPPPPQSSLPKLFYI